MDTKIELAWAAGFFDGEGSIYAWTLNKNKYATIQLDVHQSDIRPLERFWNAIGGIGNLKGPYYKKRITAGEPYQGIWKWNVSGMEKVTIVSQLLWPYLSEPKQEQILSNFEKLDRLKKICLDNRSNLV